MKKILNIGLTLLTLVSPLIASGESMFEQDIKSIESAILELNKASNKDEYYLFNCFQHTYCDSKVKQPNNRLPEKQNDKEASLY